MLRRQAGTRPSSRQTAISWRQISHLLMSRCGNWNGTKSFWTSEKRRSSRCRRRFKDSKRSMRIFAVLTIPLKKNANCSKQQPSQLLQQKNNLKPSPDPKSILLCPSNKWSRLPPHRHFLKSWASVEDSSSNRSLLLTSEVAWQG